MSEHDPIRPSDFLASVFSRNERLIDIIASHSPHLAKLRSSPIRRVMSRVTTVAQAARLCGIPAEQLATELNAALGIAAEPVAGATSPTAARQAEETFTVGAPPEFADKRIVELDVREELRNGTEPFSRIMAAVAGLADDQVLHLRTTFEPVPLFTVMQKRGFAHSALRHAADDWSVWFQRLEAASAAQVRTRYSTPVMEDRPPRDGLTDMRIDVRGLEPPEPMLRTLEALEALPPACALLHVNVRVPQLLLPILRERGFDFQIDESHRGEVHVRIWRRTPASSH